MKNTRTTRRISALVGVLACSPSVNEGLYDYEDFSETRRVHRDITNGQNAYQDAYPWQVAIYESNDAPEDVFCGSMLLSDEWYPTYYASRKLRTLDLDRSQCHLQSRAQPISSLHQQE